MADLEVISENLFESIKHVNEYGQEYWFARELQTVLDYKLWQKFHNLIERAKEACEGSGNAVADHFIQVGKMVIHSAVVPNVKSLIISYRVTPAI